MTETQPEENSDDFRPEDESISSQCKMSEFRYGQPCPSCGSKDVGYDGLLNLVCKNCGLRQGGVFT
jgi:NADH pyrophosphatase NudC (nudix superfamily)